MVAIVSAVSGAFTQMAKQNVSARLDEEMIQSLKKLSDQTGKTVSDLITEAIGSYLKIDVDTVGDRLETLEAEVGDLRKKLRSLAG